MKTFLFLVLLLSSFNSFARKPAIEPVMEIAVNPENTPPIAKSRGFNFSTKPLILKNTATPLNNGAPVLLIIAFLAIPFISWLALSSKINQIQKIKQESGASNMVILDDYRKDKQADQEKTADHYKEAS